MKQSIIIMKNDIRNSMNFSINGDANAIDGSAKRPKLTKTIKTDTPPIILIA